MNEKIRWGILSTGKIAHAFARDLQLLPDAELIAVGSRSQSSAERFGDVFDVPHRHSSYEDLAVDPDVDVIYVATPHHLHKDNTIMALRAGKAVLCEKPIAINASETEAMIRTAREEGRFLMEAMWTRFVPVVAAVRALVLQKDAIGPLRMFAGDFGFRADYDPHGRLFAPEMGGGALLDVGIYPISMASMFFERQPDEIATLAHLGETGVDEEAAMIFSYATGQLATLYTANRTRTPIEATVMGEDGYIRIHSPMNHPEQFTLSMAGQPDELIEMPIEGEGYQYQAAEVMQCLRQNELESAVMPLNESLAIMQTLDRIRERWNLKYPMEK